MKARTNQKKQEREYKHDFMVRRAHQFEDGGVVFDLQVDDITIYGCRVVESRQGDFIGWPSRKGSDGNYYGHAYVPVTHDQTEDILDKVSEALTK